MKKIMNFLMLSCRKSAGLIDKKSVAQLSKLESIQLALHKSMCKACTAYEIQAELLENILHFRFCKEISENNYVMSNQNFKNRISSKL